MLDGHELTVALQHKETSGSLRLFTGTYMFSLLK